MYVTNVCLRESSQSKCSKTQYSVHRIDDLRHLKFILDFSMDSYVALRLKFNAWIPGRLVHLLNRLVGVCFLYMNLLPVKWFWQFIIGLLYGHLFSFINLRRHSELFVQRMFMFLRFLLNNFSPKESDNCVREIEWMIYLLFSLSNFTSFSKVYINCKCHNIFCSWFSALYALAFHSSVCPKIKTTAKWLF